ncbi:meiotically up-regulated gene 113-domain-containing protein [Gongronella butleri]|nr:meiotically up-regulated gene 113-domain-containing protein [Gongronella butleri]
MTPVYCHDHQPRVAPVTTATMATSTAHPPIESVSTTMDRPAASITRAPPSKLYDCWACPRMSTDTYCYFKIGRSTNPTRRMYQVMNQCGYQPRLLDVMPAWTRTGATLQQQQRKTRPGKAERWTKCPLSHRVERLIHLELASLYPSTGGFKCKACGSTHREWFRVKRPMVLDDTGAQRPMTDHEVWLEKIRPVMLHWVRYGVVASATLTSHHT